MLRSGNCLFSSLSDQIFGTPNRHAEVRATVVQFIRDHKDRYIGYFAAGESLKDRSHMSRRAGQKSQTKTNDSETTEQTMERHMAVMAKDREWGGNREISAFAAAYNKNVVLFQPEQKTVVFQRDGYVAGEAGPYVHIAYGGADIYEHYSSVRKVDGGLPGPDDEIISYTETDNAPIATAKQIATIKEALEINGLQYDTEMIKNILEKCRGDLNNAFSHLIDRDQPSSSRSSSQHSSGSKRSAADSDTEDQRRIKRRDTRLSLKRRARVTGVVHGEADSVEVAFHVRVDSPPGEGTKGDSEGYQELNKGKGIAAEEGDNNGKTIGDMKEKADQEGMAPAAEKAE